MHESGSASTALLHINELIISYRPTSGWFADALSSRHHHTAILYRTNLVPCIAGPGLHLPRRLASAVQQRPEQRGWGELPHGPTLPILGRTTSISVPRSLASQRRAQSLLRRGDTQACEACSVCEDPQNAYSTSIAPCWGEPLSKLLSETDGMQGSVLSNKARCCCYATVMRCCCVWSLAGRCHAYGHYRFSSSLNRSNTSVACRPGTPPARTFAARAGRSIGGAGPARRHRGTLSRSTCGERLVTSTNTQLYGLRHGGFDNIAAVSRSHAFPGRYLTRDDPPAAAFLPPLTPAMPLLH